MPSPQPKRSNRKSKPRVIGRLAREADQAWKRGEAVITMRLMDYWTLDTQARKWQAVEAMAKHGR